MGARQLTRYHALDGLRGFAALAIVVRHGADLFGGNPFGSSYLAVDLFFVLSGFVLAHAYEHRFDAGLTPWRFMQQRLLRLYPLYLLGVAITLAGVALAWKFGSAIRWQPQELMTAAGFNLLFLPAPPIPGRPLFPMDAPGWSLFFELFVNLVWALSVRWLTTRVLVWTVALGAALLIASGLHYGSLDTGWEWPIFAGGFARVLFSFPAGALIYRLSRSWKPSRLSPWLLAVAMMALFWPMLSGANRMVYDLAAVLVGFPAIVAVGAMIQPAQRDIPALAFLGLTSYPIYVLHSPVLLVTIGVVAKVLGAPVQTFAPWMGFGFLALALVGSWLVAKFYDEPARALFARSRTPAARAIAR